MHLYFTVYTSYETAFTSGTTIKQDNNISGKEVVAHYISTILNLENLEDLLIIDNDFKEYIDLIIKDLSKNPDDTSKKHLE